MRSNFRYLSKTFLKFGSPKTNDLLFQGVVNKTYSFRYQKYQIQLAGHLLQQNANLT